MTDDTDYAAQFQVPKYKLDYSKVIDRTQKDLTVYNTKFKLWDDAMARGLVTKYEVLGTLLRDPTIYAYALYKVKHTWYQDMIACDSHRFKIFAAANQIGKSYLLNTQAVRDLVIDHGHAFNRAIISKSLQQAKYQMNRIRNMLRSGNIRWEEDKGSTDNIMILSVDIFDTKGYNKNPNEKQKRPYKYTNYLILAPCTEGALGYDLHAMDLDEFDWWDIDTKTFFYQIAQPRTYQTGGNITIFSNPNGREGFMYELWNQMLPASGPFPARYKWHRYQFNYWDKENPTQKEFDELTVGMTRRQVESTLLGEFSTSEGSFFTYEEIKRTEDVSLQEAHAIGKQTFWFLDVGASIDASVLTGCYVEPDKDNDLLKHVYMFKIHEYPIGYPLYRVAGSYSDNLETDGWHHEKSVKEYLQEAGMDGITPVFGCDTQNNKGMVGLFNAIGIYPLEVVFSGPAKAGFYTKAKYFFEKGLLHRVVNKGFDYQFSVIQAKRSQRGYFMFHHERESDHDDVCFVAGTKILTKRGQVNIENVTPYDYVMTRKGYKRVKAITSRDAEVMNKFGLTGTPDHPFILANDKIEKFKNLNVFHPLYIWNEKQSSIMVRSITDILNQRGDIYESIFGHIKNGNLVHNLYIETSGKTNTEKSQRNMLSITKMGIPLTTQLKTLNVLKEKYTTLTTCKNSCKTKNLENKQFKTLSNHNILRRYGINLQKVENGIRTILQSRWGKSLIDKLIVRSVEKSLKQKNKMQPFVVIPVTKNTDGKFVKRVYNLHVQGCHEYFANNILVHNCDSTVGCIWLADGMVTELGLTVVDGKGTTYNSRTEGSYDALKKVAAENKTERKEQMLGNTVQTLKQYNKQQEIYSRYG